MPTRVKKLDRKALRVGPAPASAMPTNSESSFGGKHSDTTGVARQQQARGLDEHIVQIEELAPGRSAGGVARQHRIGGKQRGKQHDVAEDEDPEPVSDDGTGRCQAAAVPLQGIGRQPINRDNAHATPRRPDRARSIRAISTAGIAVSRASIQPNANNVIAAPARLSATNHQMCQIRAKPVADVKKAMTNPVALLRGTSISW